LSRYSPRVRGGCRGYAIFEGSPVDLQTLHLMWVHFVKFTTRELLTIKDRRAAAGPALPSSPVRRSHGTRTS
jgi:hypothetical protein